jgi:hypothetical protein
MAKKLDKKQLEQIKEMMGDHLFNFESAYFDQFTVLYHQILSNPQATIWSGIIRLAKAEIIDNHPTYATYTPNSDLIVAVLSFLDMEDGNTNIYWKVIHKPHKGGSGNKRVEKGFRDNYGPLFVKLGNELMVGLISGTIKAPPPAVSSPGTQAGNNSSSAIQITIPLNRIINITGRYASNPDSILNEMGLYMNEISTKYPDNNLDQLLNTGTSQFLSVREKFEMAVGSGCIIEAEDPQGHYFGYIYYKDRPLGTFYKSPLSFSMSSIQLNKYMADLDINRKLFVPTQSSSNFNTFMPLDHNASYPSSISSNNQTFMPTSSPNFSGAMGNNTYLPQQQINASQSSFAPSSSQQTYISPDHNGIITQVKKCPFCNEPFPTQTVNYVRCPNCMKKLTA